jgi:hypothetical protein
VKFLWDLRLFSLLSSFFTYPFQRLQSCNEDPSRSGGLFDQLIGPSLVVLGGFQHRDLKSIFTRGFSQSTDARVLLIFWPETLKSRLEPSPGGMLMSW